VRSKGRGKERGGWGKGGEGRTPRKEERRERRQIQIENLETPEKGGK